MAVADRDIRILVPIAHAALGGSELALLRLIDACCGLRLRFHVWLFAAGPLQAELEKRGVTWERLPRRWLRTPWGLVALRRRLRRAVPQGDQGRPAGASEAGALIASTDSGARVAPDAVYLHAGRAITLASRWAGIPCLERINMPRARGARGWCRHRALDRMLTNLNTRVLAVSEALRSELIDRGVAADKIAVLRDPVYAGRFRRPELREPLREELGIAPDERLVLTIGRLTEQKGYADLLPAAAACREAAEHGTRPCPRVRFLIVGEGPLSAWLGERIVHWELEGTIAVRPFHEEVASLYAAADLYLQSSLWEGLAAVIVEARAAGLPIVATDVGGTREGLRGYPAAHLIPPGDSCTMARAVLEVLSGAPERVDAPLPAEFSPEEVARRFDACVRQVTG
jgi:glycosyltransferase involved in cell wall biosynthesis